MSGTDAPLTSPTSTTSTAAAPGLRWYTGRSELFVAAGVILLAVVLTIGTVTMSVPEGAAWPGPQFFPSVVTGFLYVVGIALAVEVLGGRRRTRGADGPPDVSDEMLADLGGLDGASEIPTASPGPAAHEAANEPRTDWRTLAITVAALVAFSLLLPFVGWLISSAALFWTISRAFGSRRPLFDIAVSALVASATQLAFSAGLGLALPAGILEGTFSWIS